jgi:hypothetical protein
MLSGVPDIMESGEFARLRDDLILSGVTLWTSPGPVLVLGEELSIGDRSPIPPVASFASLRAGAIRPGSVDEKALTAG